MPPKKKTRSNTMAFQDGSDHGDSGSLQNASFREQERAKDDRHPEEESAAAGKGSEQKGPSFVTQEDVVAMLEK
ncbi:unnamed protein product [Prunus brigantina]